MTTRLATDVDLPAVVALVNAAYRGLGARPGWTSEVDLLEGPRIDEPSLRADLAANPAARLLVMAGDDADGLIGCVLLEPKDDAPWSLGLLSVHPEGQGRQTGRALLAAAEAMVRAEGGRSIRLTVIDTRESLMAWYVRRGYVATGETLPFPYEKANVERPRQGGLQFMVFEKRLF